MKCDPSGLTFVNFYLHFLKMIIINIIACGPLVHMLKTRLFKHYAIYKVYVNICDFRVGSYVILGTRASQHYIYMSLGCSMPYIFAFGLLVQKILKIFPLFGPFLGFHLNKIKSPCPKSDPCQFKMHSGQWFNEYIF